MNETLKGCVSSETLRDILLGFTEDICNTRSQASVTMIGSTCCISIGDASITISAKGGAL